MTGDCSIVWFRRDLRIADNPALGAAIAAGRPVKAIYVHDESMRFSPGGARKWFLHHALTSLGLRLARIGVSFDVFAGNELETVERAASEFDAAELFWNRRYAADEITVDKALKSALTRRGVGAHSFNGSLLREPWEIETKSGGPFKVFTPFWKTLSALGPSRAVTGMPRALGKAIKPALADAIALLNLLPKRPNWASEFDAIWTPNEAGAESALSAFINGAVVSYDSDRDRPDLEGTSRQSPHLALGTISPVRIWNAVTAAAAAGEIPDAQAMKFLSEIAWREFAYHLLYFNPEIDRRPLRPAFENFPWRDDKSSLAAWTRGDTGIPIVDAGMRQLWRTGWMHNRVRMITASFLIKNLLIDWREGERWFRDTLVDADPANNPASWQWVAGCGADAAPYFRIFNPVTQGEKFDPDGTYVRRYVPEIAALPNKFIHAPWKAPENDRPSDYPEPIVDLGSTRERALAAYQSMKTAADDLEIVGFGA